MNPFSLLSPEFTIPDLTVRTVTATRYVTPLREGGSLPAIVEADDLGTYVLKFRGAGQGPKVLVTELLAGQVARAIGLPMPEIVLVEVDPALGRNEPDWEIKALLEASPGLNLALDYLPGSFAFDPVIAPPPDADLASAIVWFDAYVTNVDRTVRNTNLLVWHRSLWLIDNGAALYAQYAGPNFAAQSRNPFPLIRDHVLLGRASELNEADGVLSARLPPEIINTIVRLVPDTWLEDPNFSGPEEHRQAYLRYLLDRLKAPRAFVEEAINVRARLF